MVAPLNRPSPIEDERWFVWLPSSSPSACFAAAAAVYAEPPADAGDDPPVLLKKKRAPPVDAPKPKADKKDQEKELKKPASAEPDADKGRNRNSRGRTPRKSSNASSKNMHTIEDRLAKKELGDATRQAEDDAFKDLDSLIDLTENPPESKDESKQLFQFLRLVIEI